MTELKFGVPVLLNWNGEAFYRGRVREFSWIVTGGEASTLFEGLIEEGPYKGCKLLCTGRNYRYAWKELVDEEPIIHTDPLQMAIPNVLGDLPATGELLVIQQKRNDWKTAKVTGHDSQDRQLFWAVYLSGPCAGIAFPASLKYEGSLWLRLGNSTPSTVAHFNRLLAEAREKIAKLEARLTAPPDEAAAIPVVSNGQEISRRPQRGDTIFFLPKNPHFPSVASKVHGRVSVHGRVWHDGFWIIGPDGLRLNLLDNEKDITWSWFRPGPSAPGGSLL